MDHVKLTQEKLNLEEIYNLVCSPEYGAVSLFVGTTRDNFDGKIVEKLEYEAYDKMAIKSLNTICKNVREKYKIGNIAIIHRLGDVPVQEASVIIAVSAPHRKLVFEALSFAIDSLKADVPIWKKEIYQGGSSPQWKENIESIDVASCSSDNPDCIQMQEEIVQAEKDNEISGDLIQINTNAQEINRRIAAFMDRKRHEMNINNIEDFCLKKRDSGDEDFTCARTNAILFRRKDSKTHLKVHRVENVTGPQTKMPEFAQTESENGKCPPGAKERLANAEQFLNLKNDSLNVYRRLKAIEDKILFLESISPEYFDFARHGKSMEKNFAAKKKYSCQDIDMRLNDLKSKFMRK